MRRFYEVQCSFMSGQHEHSLPGVSCEVCGQSWATNGLVFPTRGPDVASEPGTELGPFREEGPRDHCNAFLWSGGTVVSIGLADELRERGLHTSAGVPAVSARKGRATLVELELPYVGHQPEERLSEITPCTQCGFASSAMRGWSGSLVRHSIPAGTHLFRVPDFPTRVLVSAEALEVLVRHEPECVRFEELLLVE